MNFEMTGAQVDAAKTAMGHAPSVYMHLILFFTAGCAVIWSITVMMALFKKMQRHQTNVPESLFDMCMVVLILIMAGAYAYYS